MAQFVIPVEVIFIADDYEDAVKKSKRIVQAMSELEDRLPITRIWSDDPEGCD